MLKRIGYILVLLFMISEGFAQKILEKSWDAKEIEGLEIISDEVFKINLFSEETDQIQLITRIEGENYEQVVVQVSEAHQTIRLTTGYTPYFEATNDKLAAHKVISIEMDLYVPEHLEVFIQGAIVSVETLGVFKKLRLELDTGNCELHGFEGDALLNTKSGNITVYGKSDVFATGATKGGTLRNELSSPEKFRVRAQSVNGDITLLKSQ
jgi:hypothetical protein